MPFLALFTAVLLLGIADAMVNTYIVLYGADVAHLSPPQIGAWATTSALAGIIIGWWLGRRFDRRPTRIYAVAVIVSAAAGYALLPSVAGFPILITMAATILGAAGAAFPQLFSIARAVLGERSASIRSAWSLAWAVGPLIGAAILAGGGYSWLMWATAAAFLATALTVLLAPRPAPVAAGSTEGGSAPILLIAGVTLFFGAMFAGSFALPLYVTRALHQEPASVGLLTSVCAAIEVAVTLGVAALPARISQRLLILSGFGVFVVYYALTVMATGMPLLLAAQIPRAIAIAVVGTAGMRWFQDLLAPAAGRATTLFANATTAGLVISGIVSGLAVEHYGYRTTLLLCGAASALGALAFAAGSRGGVPTPTH